MFPTYPTRAYLERLDTINAQFFQAAPDQAVLRLYKNDVSPDANMALATFVEADFTGYAPVPLTMGIESINGQGLVVSRTNLANFNSTPGSDPQTVYGVYITYAEDSAVYAAQRFDTPQTMGGAFPQAVSGVWRTSEPLSTYGWIDVEN